MNHDINPKDLEELLNMGADHTQAVKALKICKTKTEAIEYLFPSPVKKMQPRSSIDDLAQAIQNSLKEVDSEYELLDISNPESIFRTEMIPVGLKNIGNTCYFNSLMQTYFMIPKFIKEILSFQSDNVEPSEDNEVKRASIGLIKELQRLFGSMIIGNRKFIDPSKVLDCLVDDSGNKVIIGDQKDVGEFNMNLIARIEEGLKSANNASAGRQSIPDLNSIEHSGINIDGLVSQLFYAKQHEIVTAKEVDGQKLIFENIAIFGQLNLDVNKKELYRAWEDVYHTMIEEYATPSGHKTFAIQEVWPEKLPGILLFQIQRVRYDPTSKQSIKVNTPFTFPCTIVGDRFLLKNKPRYLLIREQVLLIKTEIARLEKELLDIENYQNSDKSLVNILTQVSLFLDTQLYSIIPPNKKTIDSNILNVPEDSLNNCQKVLDNYRNLVDNHRVKLKEQLTKLEEELERLYDAPELKEYEYFLHSILIHEGKAETGHYYAYIYDSEENVWRKYSDTLIKNVSFEEVMRDAVGGYGEASAYCLIYIHKSFKENHGKIHKDKDEDDCSSTNRLEKYATYLQNTVNAEVLEENAKLIREIANFKAKMLVDRIKTLYDDRFSMIIAWSADNSYSEKKADIINFVMLLRMNKLESLSRWVLLNICVKEITGKTIEQIKSDLLLYNKIDLMLCRYTFGPKSLELLEMDQKHLSEYFYKFQSKYYHARISMYILDSLIKEDLLVAFQASMHQIEKINDINDEYQRVPLDARKVIALRLTSFINGCTYDKEILQAVYWAKHLVFVISTIDDKSFNTLINNRIITTQQYIKKYLPNYYNVDIKQEFEEILKKFNSIVPNPSFPIEIIDEELSNLLIADVDPYQWMDHYNSIAWEYSKLLRRYEESFMYDWARLLKKIQERAGLSEQEFKEIERKNGIVEKIMW